MTLQDFENLLDRHGGDPAAWPSARRVEALELASSSLSAAAAWQAARDVDAALRSRAASASTGHDAIVSRAMRHNQERPSGAVRARWTAAVAAALALGVLVGSAWPEARAGEGVEIVAAYGFDPGYAFDVD